MLSSLPKAIITKISKFKQVTTVCIRHDALATHNSEQTENLIIDRTSSNCENKIYHISQNSRLLMDR